MSEYYARCTARTAKGAQCTRQVSHTGATTCAQHTNYQRKEPPMTDDPMTIAGFLDGLIAGGSTNIVNDDEPAFTTCEVCGALAALPGLYCAACGSRQSDTTERNEP